MASETSDAAALPQSQEQEHLQTRGEVLPPDESETTTRIDHLQAAFTRKWGKLRKLSVKSTSLLPLLTSDQVYNYCYSVSFVFFRVHGRLQVAG